MTPSSLQVAMLGGHDSGKTSFLGALWASVRSQTAGKSVSLEGALPIDTAYLDAAEHALLGCERVERTKRDTGERVELRLSVDGTVIDFVHHDVSGETYEMMLEQRVAPPALLESLGGADALMLFVHPAKVTTPPTIAQATQLVADAGGEEGDPDRDNPSPPGPDSEPDPVDVWQSTPTSVRVVDLLQIALANLRPREGRTRVALVISAWDTVKGISPADWVATTLPLLDQYLKSNTDLFESKIYGVSAQGGDFDDEMAVDKLLPLELHERTRVISQGTETKEIAEPLRWLVGMAQ